MFCWPPYATEMATDALVSFSGDRVIYIGECGGCTADNEFEDLLEKEWTEVEDFRIPKWFGIHDKMRLFNRKRAL
jgi:nucleoside phosphorylase